MPGESRAELPVLGVAKSRERSTQERSTEGSEEAKELTK
jgi:hypothetical protein